MNLDRKILFFARDPGGASPMVDIIPNFSNKDVFAKDYAIQIFQQNSINCNSIDLLESLKKKLSKYHLVVTGTSYQDNSDKELWLEAKNQGITSVAFFDHWMNFERFYHSQKKKEIFPDYILVIDNIAKEGIIKNNPNCTSEIIPVGSSFLENVFKQKNTLYTENNSYLYAAEKIQGYDLEKKYAINEFTQFELLLKILEKRNEKTKLFFRSHPKHDKIAIKKYLDSLTTQNCSIFLDTTPDKYPLLNSVDAAFGINSMVLVEALVLEKRVCSIGNNMKNPSSFELIKKELIFSSKTEEDLINFLDGNIQTIPYNSTFLKNSKKRIMTFLVSL